MSYSDAISVLTDDLMMPYLTCSFCLVSVGRFTAGVMMKKPVISNGLGGLQGSKF